MIYLSEKTRGLLEIKSPQLSQNMTTETFPSCGEQVAISLDVIDNKVNVAWRTNSSAATSVATAYLAQKIQGAHVNEALLECERFSLMIQCISEAQNEYEENFQEIAKAYPKLARGMLLASTGWAGRLLKEKSAFQV